MIKDFVTIDRQKRVRHRAKIGSIADFVEAGLLPEYTKGRNGGTVLTKNIPGTAVRHDFGGDVIAFANRTERAVEGYLRKVYA